MKKKDKIKKNHLKSRKILLVSFLVVLLLVMLVLDLLIVRYVTARQTDDINIFILCENNLLNKSSMLMVIPLYEGQSIADNMTWCNSILKLNKTLGMHGVYHTFNEFNELRNESYILSGMNEFKKCFGYYPKYFEAPQLALSKENGKLIESMNMTVFGYGYNTFHKVYHCSDTGLVSNRFIDFV